MYKKAAKKHGVSVDIYLIDTMGSLHESSWKIICLITYGIRAHLL